MAIEQAADIVSRYGKAHIKMPKDNLLVQFLEAMEKEVIAQQLVWNCLTAKNDVYANEREVRYIIMNVPGQFEDIRKSSDLSSDTEKKLKAVVDGYAKSFA